MLILPLHRPFTRANFPFVTVLLALANAFVFFALQTGDAPRLQALQRQYLDSGLGALEAPAYRRHLELSGQRPALAALDAVPERDREAYVGARTLTDVAFVRALADGALFADVAQLQRWKPLRAEYERAQAEVFTLRHIMRSSEFDPGRMLSAAFLHGDFMHLLGNMVFLLALGLLVEGAVGPALFVLLYLLGAYGSAAASLWWRWGEAGGGLGASGAIAALMGAFCLVWGLRPVRFFYWIGVVFDYVRAPAIWLFPAWLGWELFNLLTRSDLNIGFDAHAGGLVTGALVGAAYVALGRVRGEFVDEPIEAAADTRWERAQQHLGRMQLAEAEALLAELAQEQPRRFDLRLARYRVARNGARRDALAQRSVELLALDPDDAAQARTQAEALAALDAAGHATEPARRQALLRAWTRAGALDAVETALDHASATQLPDENAAQASLELALAHRDHGRPAEQAKWLQRVIERYPGQPQAQKARFLLEHEVRQPV